MDDRPILLTGASGFVGKHVLLALLRAGHRVRASLRDPGRAAEVRDAVMPHLPAGAERALEFVTLDLLADAGWSEAAEDAAALIHTASPFPVAEPDDPQVLIRPAVEGTLRALRAARAAGVARVVVTSSVAAVASGPARPGQGTHDEEDWSPESLEAIGAYSLSKTLAERAAWSFRRDEAPAMALTVLNPAMVFGPPLDRHYGDSIGVLRRFVRGRDPMVPRTGFAIVDARDVAEAHLRALTRPETEGQRIILAAGSLWLSDLGRVLKAGFPDRRFATRTAPDLFVRALALVDSGARAAVPGLGHMTRVSNRLARDLLGMDFIPAEEAVLAAARWLIDHDEA